MTGKEKCEFLKEIRKNMAKENGIPYEPRECHHEGDCSGTCPLCEKEAADLLEELKKKALAGEEIHVDNDAIEVLEQISGGKEDIEDDDNEVELLGDIPAGGYIRSDEQLERIRMEKEYKRFLLEKEQSVKSSNKSGIWSKIKKKLRDCFRPPLMGLIIDEDEHERDRDDKTALMGDIVPERWLHYESKPEPERESDITWNMDDDENPIISTSANIRNDADKNADSREDVFNLTRFLHAQEYESGGYKDALQEVKDGAKRKHWIWYIFPQINGLGHSDYQEYYGIKSLEEARAYLDNNILGDRLREISETLLQLEGNTTLEIFGGIDSMKVRSCMTLFDIVSPHDIFEKVLDKYYNGKRCELTLSRFNIH